MLFRLLIHLRSSSSRRVSRILRHPLVWLPVCAILVMGDAPQSEAGPVEQRPQASISAAPAPASTSKVKISKLPHLVAVGPMEVAIKPLAGPRIRRAPALPTPKPVEPEPAAAPANSQPQETPPSTPPEPSVLSPDAPHTLLPAEKPPITPPVVKKEEAKESVLVPAGNTEPELKDAVMYFETPVGPHGSRVTIPAIVPLSSPTGAPQPESRAIYRKEKE